MVAYSFWVPQIILNMREDRRDPPVCRQYVNLISVTRLVLPLYFFGCPHNILNMLANVKHSPNYFMCVALVLWMAAQVFVLHLQQVYGQQFLVPSRFLPPRYKYTIYDEALSFN